MRLNQLHLLDETRLGLLLIWTYMVLDAAFTMSLGGYPLLVVLGIAQPRPWMVGALQVVMLLGLTAAFAALKLRRIRTDLGLREAKDVDAKLAADADYLGRHIARGRARFFVTANTFDTNAFCVAARGGPWIVLGGGLRLLLRKDKEQALAVVSHECAHVAAGDTLYLLVAWYSFVAYVCMAIVNLILLQGLFWVHFPASYASYQTAGLGLGDFLINNASPIFRNGVPTFVAAIGIAIALMHFIRQREFRADEVTALAGLRGPLASVLAREQRGGLRLLARFHPEAGQRAQRLKDERNWAHLDWLFIASMAFVVERLDDFTPSNLTSMPAHAGLSLQESLELTFEIMRSDLLGSVSLLAGILIAFIVVLNVYRVAATQYKLGGPLIRRLALSADVATAIFAGVFLSHLTSASVVTVTSSSEPAATLAMALDSSLYGGTLSATLGFVFAIALILRSGPTMRKPARGPLIQALLLCGSTLLLAFLLQIPFSAVIAGAEMMDVQLLPAVEISWLPNMSRNLSVFPSLLQILLVLGVLLIALKLAAAYAGKKGNAPSVTIHPSRLAEDRLPAAG
jgi:Zn-dependent protease with chaperone function